MVSDRDIAVNKMGKDTTLVKLMLGVRLTDIVWSGVAVTRGTVS